MTFSLPDNLSPDSIDTLTELSAILGRFRATLSSQATSVSTPNLGNLTGLPGTTPAPSAATELTPAGVVGGLGFKDLPAATDNVKHKLQRARLAVQKLPDISRDLAAQEKEIARLEERNQRQVQELLKIKEEGENFARAEQRKRDEGEKMMT